MICSFCIWQRKNQQLVRKDYGNRVIRWRRVTHRSMSAARYHPRVRMLQQYRATLFELQHSPSAHATCGMTRVCNRLCTFVAATESLDSKMWSPVLRSSFPWLAHGSLPHGRHLRPSSDSTYSATQIAKHCRKHAQPSLHHPSSSGHQTVHKATSPTYHPPYPRPFRVWSTSDRVHRPDSMR